MAKKMVEAVCEVCGKLAMCVVHSFDEGEMCECGDCLEQAMDELEAMAKANGWPV